MRWTNRAARALAMALDVTAEGYPYTVAMTQIHSAYFNPGWREQRGLDYEALEIPETGERLTKERFEQLHAASDGGAQHPRGAGTRARVLSRYLRDQKTLSLPAAIAKMSLMPAQRLEQLTPLARRLGRMQEGARADVAVFDPETIKDRATFRASTTPSAGMRYVLVNGMLVVEGGKIVKGAAPGQPLLRVAPH